MKRKYESPRVEVEIFEANEYIAACYRSYSPGLEDCSESEESQRGIIRENLYLDTNNSGRLEFKYDAGIGLGNRCFNLGETFNASSDEVQTGFWYAHFFENPGEEKYKKVNVLNKHGKYHIVTKDGANHS